MLNIAVKAARAAAKVILPGQDRIDSVRISEKSRYNFVSSLYEYALKDISEVISSANSEHKIITEASSEYVELNSKDSFWLVNPLDGMDNFIHCLPHFATSIAFYSRGELEFSLVYNPSSDEMFTAVRGSGTRLNNQKRLRVRPVKNIAATLLATAYPSHDLANLSSYTSAMNDLMPQISGLRSSGCTSLDLAYVAAGRLDAFLNTNLKPWDVAAGNLLVSEAGGYVKDFNANDDILSHKQILCANPDLYKLLQLIISRHYI